MDKKEFVKILEERGFDDEFIAAELDLAKEAEDAGLVYPYELTLELNLRPLDPPNPASPK